jgi:hypothetical protein
MESKIKINLISLIAIFIFLILSSACIAETFNWMDYREPFSQSIRIGYSGVQNANIKVNLPDSIFEKNNEFPIVIRHAGIDSGGSNNQFIVLRINGQSMWSAHKFGDTHKDKDIKVVLKAKELKKGINIFNFSIMWTQASGRTPEWTLKEVRFDLPDMAIDTMAKSPSPKIDKSKQKKPTEKNYEKDRTPPQIVITSHETSRGLKVVEKKKKVRIAGKIIDESNLVEVIVNGKDASFDSFGNFAAEVYLGLGENKIIVSAMDRFENRAHKSFIILREDKFSSAGEIRQKKIIGNYYALVIGNNDYLHLRTLKTAINDAKAVSYTLRTQFGFDTKLLLDVGRDEIIMELNKCRKKLNEQDNFLIYYAGHGEFDKATSKAYWLPIDAKRDDDTKWIIVDTITSNIKRMAANHIIIVSDSCYSGTLTRQSITEIDSAGNRGRYLGKMRKKKSRTLLASGGNEPVSDSGGYGHSVFASAFLQGLKEISYKEFTAEELYYKYIKELVAGGSEQTPEYSIIRNSGHGGGDFVFIRNLNSH